MSDEKQDEFEDLNQTGDSREAPKSVPAFNISHAMPLPGWMGFTSFDEHGLAPATITELENRGVSIKQPLVEGGHANVFLATRRHNNAQIEVIVKIYKRRDELSHNNFSREVEYLTRIAGNKTVADLFPAIQDHIDTPDALPTIIMHPVSGKSVNDYSRPNSNRYRAGTSTGRMLTLVESVQFAIDLFDALARVHKFGILHGDVSSGNVMMSSDSQGRLKPILIDLSCARRPGELHTIRTSDGKPSGTDGFASQEQLEGTERRDEQSDTRQATAVFYDLLLGRVPASDRDQDAPERWKQCLAQARVDAKPIPARLRHIILDGLDKKHRAKYKTPEQIAHDLKEWVRTKRSRPALARKVAGMLIVMILVLAGAGAIYINHVYSEFREQRQAIEIAVDQADEIAHAEIPAVRRLLDLAEDKDREHARAMAGWDLPAAQDSARQSLAAYEQAHHTDALITRVSALRSSVTKSLIETVWLETDAGVAEQLVKTREFSTKLGDALQQEQLVGVEKQFSVLLSSWQDLMALNQAVASDTKWIDPHKYQQAIEALQEKENKIKELEVGIAEKEGEAMDAERKALNHKHKADELEDKLAGLEGTSAEKSELERQRDKALEDQLLAESNSEQYKQEINNLRTQLKQATERQAAIPDLLADLDNTETRIYTVQPGDTLSSIADAHYKDVNKWTLLAQSNPLVDPARLIVGEQLVLPREDASEPRPNTPGTDRIYTVRTGDNLAKISEKFYGNSESWDLIYNRNRKIIGSAPDGLRAGMKLVIPVAYPGLFDPENPTTNLTNDFTYRVSRYTPTNWRGDPIDPSVEPGYFRVDITTQRSLRRLETVPKDVMFFIDTSASISQAWLDEVVDGVDSSLITLNKDDRFNIALFNDKLSLLSDSGPIDANSMNINTARKFLGSVVSAGHTDVNAAMAGLNKWDTDSKRDYKIVLISDGFSTRGVVNTADLINLITRNTDMKTSTYCVGVGRRQNRELLNVLSYGNRGYSVYADDPGDASVVIQDLISRLRYPIIRDVKIEVEGIASTTLLPIDIPNIHLGETLRFYGRFTDEDAFTMRLKGRSGSKDVEFKVTQRFSEADAGGQTVANEWAFRQLHDLYDQIMRGDGEVEQLNQQVEALRKKYGLRTLDLSASNLNTPQESDHNNQRPGTTGLAQSDDDSLAAITIAPPTIPKPDIKVETPAKSDTLKKLELELLPYFSLPVDDQPIEYMMQEYRQLQSDDSLPAIDQQIIDVRLRIIERRKQIKETLVRAENANVENSEKKATPPQKDAEADQSKFTAVGILQPSTVYDGKSLPLLYRIVDPAPSGRTLAYISPTDDMNPGSMLNKLVGVVGQANYDRALKLSVIEPKRVVVLEGDEESDQ